MTNEKLLPVVMIDDDYKLLKRFAGTEIAANELSLARELDRAQIVADSDFPKDVIRLNSRVELIDLGTNKRLEFELVLPNEADMKQKRFSALSPMGIAIIGFRQGDKIKSKLPGGERNFLIEKVHNKPFAA